MFGEVKKHRLFFAVSTLALFFSFAFNAFGAMTVPSFLMNFKDSEALVVNQIRCKGQPFSSQMLEIKKITTSNTQERCDQSQLKPYSSQYGLQGKVYTLGYRVVAKVANIEVGTYVAAAQLFTALASAACFGLLTLWVRARHGLGAGIVLAVLLAVSPMLVGFGRNLYWVLPFMVLPFIYTLYAYDRSARLSRQLLFWAGLAVLLYLRYLCGYEYITTITIMVAAAVLYHLYMLKSTKRVYAKQVAIVFSVSIVSFVAAVGTHIYSLASYAGSTGQAVAVIKQRALERTTRSGEYLAYPVSGLKSNLPDHYAIANSYIDFESHIRKPSQSWSSLASLMNYVFMPLIGVPVALSQPFATYSQSLAVFVITLSLLYIGRRKWVTAERARAVNGLFLGAAVGFLGYLSWLVLARSHSLVHGHINGILLYLPFAFFAYTLIGAYLSSRVRLLRKKLRL